MQRVMIYLLVDNCNLLIILAKRVGNIKFARPDGYLGFSLSKAFSSASF
jgi:hypothetical protein